MSQTNDCFKYIRPLVLRASGTLGCLSVVFLALAWLTVVLAKTPMKNSYTRMGELVSSWCTECGQTLSNLCPKCYTPLTHCDELLNGRTCYCSKCGVQK